MKPHTWHIDPLMEQERLILDFTEAVCQQMGDGDERRRELGTVVTREELGELLGMSKAAVTRMLDGRRIMTLRDVADVFSALGCRVKLVPIPIEMCQKCAAAQYQEKTTDQKTT